MAAPEESSTTPASVLRPFLEPSASVLVLGGPIARADIPGICDRARALLEASDTDSVDCDVGAVVAPDAVVVDVLARLLLTARQLGRKMRLRHISDDLQQLLVFMGLYDVVAPCAELPLLPLQSERQAEQWKERGGVEEEDDPANPTG